MWIPLLGWISLLVLSLLSRQIWGHVALTFPAARKYDLDFLDNSRTKGPCGMPKDDINIKDNNSTMYCLNSTSINTSLRA
ncbi:hypothetical protein M8J76_016900 [Diaphorina citri]|nr:hypothetical protein M8J76_016900 [Diaphorina citri]